MALISKSLGRLAPCCALLCIAACEAEAPGGQGTFMPPAPSDAHFGDVATCAAPTAGMVVGCGQPGNVCASDVVGQNEPDGGYVDISRCTLDLTYTRGSVVTQRNRIDLVVHLGAQVSGLARIEASADGEHYEVVGFINNIPATANPLCLGRCASARCQVGQLCGDGQACWQEPGVPGEAPSSTGFCLSANCQPGGLALFDLYAGDTAGGCNTVFNVQHVRISQYAPAGRSISVDAIEATTGSYRPQEQP